MSVNIMEAVRQAFLNAGAAYQQGLQQIPKNIDMTLHGQTVPGSYIDKANKAANADIRTPQGQQVMQDFANSAAVGGESTDVGSPGRTPFDFEKPIAHEVVDTSPSMPKYQNSLTPEQRVAFNAQRGNPVINSTTQSEGIGKTAPIEKPTSLNLPSPETSSVSVNPSVENGLPNIGIPGERTYSITSTPSKADLLANQRRNIQIDGKDVQTPNDAAQINATLNGYGIKGSLTDQLQMAENTKAKLAARAENTVAAEGGTIDKQQLVNDTAQKLAYGAGHNIPPDQALSQAKIYIDRTYAKAAGVDPQSLTGFTAPDQIPGQIAQKMKTFMNGDANSTWGITPDKYSPSQTISRYSRDALDSSLDSKYPNASKLNNDMNDLYRAYDSLKTGANTEGTQAQKLANTPSQPNMFQNIIAKAKQNPLLAIGELGATAYGIDKAAPLIAGGAMGAGELINSTGLPQKIAGIFGNKDTQAQAEESQNSFGKNPSHKSSVLDQFPDVKPNIDGSWTLDQKQQPSGQYMTDAQRKQQEQNLTPGTPAYNRVENNYTKSQALAQNAVGRKGDPVYDFMTASGPSIQGVSKMLTKGLFVLPTGFMNKWKPGLDVKNYIQSTNGDPKIQGALTAIESLNDTFKVQYQRMMNTNPGNDFTIQPGDSIKQMQIKLNAQAAFLKGYYKKYEDPYLATSQETGTANQTANDAAIQPTSPTSNEGNVGFSHPDQASYLSNPNQYLPTMR